MKTTSNSPNPLNSSNSTKQQIVIFEEDGSGDFKIAGIEVYGRNICISRVFNLEGPFPVLMDEPEEYISRVPDADLCLDFLRHPDLSQYLVEICSKKSIPVIASGQHIPGAVCPFTCCGLGRKEGLGEYGRQFGVPEYEVEMCHGRISSIKVKRWASCGATWQVCMELAGLSGSEAPTVISRQVQYLCLSDPSAFDPVSGKSAVHFAGEVHRAALDRAIKRALAGENRSSGQK